MSVSPNGQEAPHRHTLPSQLLPAAALLLEAYCCACDLGRDLWDFAVEISDLRAAGLTNNGLRWLLCKGYMRHAHEVTESVIQGRAFRPLGELTITPNACFVLTDAGVAFARASVPRPAAPTTPARTDLAGVTGPRLVPVWDSDQQELRLGGVVVKRFKVPAPNQEVILAAFEEEKWPPRIDDPLPQAHGLEPRRRLHETITSLNRNQKQQLISFRGDGSGQGVRWELTDRPRRRRAR